MATTQYVGPPVAPAAAFGSGQANAYDPRWTKYFADLEAWKAQEAAKGKPAPKIAPVAAPLASPTGTTTGGAAGVPDILSGPGYNPLAGGPAWAPGGGTSGGIAGQGLNVISGLLNPHPDTSEWDQTSAERAVAGGVAGSRMAAAEGSLLRQSEIDKRNLAGLEALNPFLNRQQQTFELIERGRQAKDLLRLEQSGQMERLSAENKAKLEQIAASGELALQEARLRGEFGLAASNISANTSRSNALLSANTSANNARLAADADRYRADASRKQPPSSAAQSIIDRILSGAGITPPSSYAGNTGPGTIYAPPPTYSDDYEYDADYLSQFDDEFA